MNSVIRIGKVSSVNASAGTVRVTYPDRDDSVTAELPVFSFTDEYKMPKVGSQVLVVHLSNGTSAGVCLGHYWNGSNRSEVTGKNVFRKELAHSYGEAYFDYDEDARKLTIYADKVEIKAKDYVKVDGADAVEVNANTSFAVDSKATALVKAASSVTVDGESEFTKGIKAKNDVKCSNGSISLATHTHTGAHGETSPAH